MVAVTGKCSMEENLGSKGSISFVIVSRNKTSRWLRAFFLKKKTEKAFTQRPLSYRSKMGGKGGGRGEITTKDRVHTEQRQRVHLLNNNYFVTFIHII